jgi:nucleotide-binding universal stress UspA family protein
MNKILLAVDETKGSLSVIELLNNLLGGCAGKSCIPRNIILLYVQRLEGRSVMDGLLLSRSETDTLKESLQGTDYQEKLNQKSDKVLGYFKDLLEKEGFTGVEPLVRQGHPAEEILKAATENQVEMIVMGSRGKRLQNLWMGSISREVANNAPMAVLIARNQGA